MKSLTLPSYAKLNLYLKVVGRRPNGYHDLVTIFHRISLKDTLRLRKRPWGFSLKISEARLSAGEDNLITKAYRELQSECPRIGGVSVFLNKKIPIGAGLGGGSSNAAAFILGVNRLFGLGLSKARMMKLGAKLGADVPFFILNTTQAVGRGIGEKLVVKPAKKRLWFLLLVSDKGLVTKKVYENLPKRLPVASLTKINHTVKLICDLLEGDGKSNPGKWLCNDLEAPAFRLRPSLRKSLDRFRKLGISTSRMSGSGPTLFAVLSNRNEALQVAKKWRGDFRRKNGRRKKFDPVIVCHSA